MTKRKKIGISLLCVFGALLIAAAGVGIWLALPPSQDNYWLTLQLDQPEKNQTAFLRGEKTMNIEQGDDVYFLGGIINENKRWHKTKFAEGNLLRIEIYDGEEKVFEKTDDLGGKYTFPWRVGCRCYSEYKLDFEYAFEQTGTYTVVVSSEFEQGWKDYSYRSEPLTVIVA